MYITVPKKYTFPLPLSLSFPLNFLSLSFWKEAGYFVAMCTSSELHTHWCTHAMPPIAMLIAMSRSWWPLPLALMFDRWVQRPWLTRVQSTLFKKCDWQTLSLLALTTLSTELWCCSHGMYKTFSYIIMRQIMQIKNSSIKSNLYK